MKFWQKHKWKIIVPVLIVLALAAAFTFGDRDMPKQKDTSEQPTVAAPVEAPEQDTAAADVPDDVETGPVETPAESTPEPSGAPQTGESAQANTEQPEYVSPEEIQASATGEYEEVGGMLIDTGTGKDKYQTDPVPEGKPIPVEPEDVEIGDAEYTCTLSISCATILDNMDLCKKEKRELVPEDGWILEPMTVTFYEGESVFNILQRTCKQQKIHMEFENTPIYNSAYIEGINNLYEFDVGNTSGWMYKVNGWFPNYGCSRYQLQNGDVIEWVYTCDLGDDVGGGYATGSE
ncbi:hypothetical protein [Oscillospiraceae bacterium]|nr:hypothetical protein [Oscillospiraceae bacterium]